MVVHQAPASLRCVLSQQLAQLRHQDLRLSGFRCLRKKQTVLRTVRRGGLRPQFDSQNRRAGRMRFEIELHQREQGRRVSATAAPGRTMRSCGGLPSSSNTTCIEAIARAFAHAPVPAARSRHARQHEEQAFQIVHRAIQFHPLGQARFKARFKRHHQVRQGATRQRVEVLPGLPQT